MKDIRFPARYCTGTDPQGDFSSALSGTLAVGAHRELIFTTSAPYQIPGKLNLNYQ